MNASNAFEVDLKCIDNLPDFISKLPAATKWLRSGEAIGAGAKIYGFRVDNVHNETYRILSGLRRNEIEVIREGGSDEERDGKEDDNTHENKRKVKQQIKFTVSDG